jgi:hypothetical protein
MWAIALERLRGRLAAAPTERGKFARRPGQSDLEATEGRSSRPSDHGESLIRRLGAKAIRDVIGTAAAGVMALGAQTATSSTKAGLGVV